MSDRQDERSGDSPIKFATLGRCPRCGRGHLFAGYLLVADQCSECGLDLGGEDAADGPAVFIMLIVGFIIAGAALWLELSFEPPTWVHMVIWPPVILILCLGALRPFKGAFIGAQYKYRSTDKSEP
ncbi:MAG: DUF983 domain-containing protein [Rhodospirillaceae bacterium]|jgi:uncharacterized protein (DUF983 family)|nr:DUF983 domain-containing protein [Rhodospirillaceae bacterium]MBT4588903.1 DUF983 domain-containing protein [Rhodospirillaceae bacterium]MBT5941305.1 DUF983 domain-containing protein [Rhodospirillaceae bacterium]MBT7268613.1 DUF983 domain-containing protein [Rhodospirillaceae bacterium]